MNIAADGTATSDPFTPTQAGKYWWLATFNGDTNNKVVSSTCGQEQSAADKVSPSIVTTATATATLPAATVSDTATLTRRDRHGGRHDRVQPVRPVTDGGLHRHTGVHRSAHHRQRAGNLRSGQHHSEYSRHLLVDGHLQRRRRQPGRVARMR